MSTVEVGAWASTPGSTLDSIQGSGDGAEAVTSIRTVKAADMVVMETEMVVTVASATTRAIKEPGVVDGLMAVAMVAGEVTVGGRTTAGLDTNRPWGRRRTPWVEAIFPSSRATWEGNLPSLTHRPSRGGATDGGPGHPGGAHSPSQPGHLAGDTADGDHGGVRAGEGARRAWCCSQDHGGSAYTCYWIDIDNGIRSSNDASDTRSTQGSYPTKRKPIHSE